MAINVLSPDKEAEMISRYLAGETSTKLAEAYHVNRATIVNYLHRKGHQPRKPGTTKRATLEVGKVAYLMRGDGKAWKVICRQLNMSRSTLMASANEYKDHLDAATAQR